MAAKHENGSTLGAPYLKPSGRERSDHEAALADTLPPQPLKELLSAGGVSLFVLSADADLIDTVQRAGGEQYPVFAVQSWTEVELAIESQRCGIVLLDTDFVGANLSNRITALAAYSARVVTLVAADRVTAQGLIGHLSDRKIHRLLIKPPTLGITRLLIESAVNRCMQLRQRSAENPVVEAMGPRAGKKVVSARMLIVAGAVLLAVGIAGAALWWPSVPPERAGADTAPALVDSPAPIAEIGSAVESPRFADLLARADQALREGRFDSPQGDNALDYYLAILAADPNEQLARAGLANVVEALFGQAEAALLASSLDGAEAALGSVRRADPTSSRLAFLDAQLAQARSAGTAAAAAPVVTSTAGSPPTTTSSAPSRPTPRRASGELDSLLTIAAARLERGQLLEPLGDSARAYIDRAAQLGPDDPRVAAARAELAAALVGSARVRLANGDIESAAALVSGARQLGADPEPMTLLDLELATARDAQTARRRSQWLAAAQLRLERRQLLEPVGDSAWHYLSGLQAEAPDLQGLDSAWADFVAAVSKSADAAIGKRDWSGAETFSAALARAPGGGSAAESLQERVAAERLQEQYLAVAVPAGELRLVVSEPPEYPAEAVRRGIEGWVDLEFVVDREGRPRDLVVAVAEPEGRFEAAASAAVENYRYAPFERAGRTYERRVRLRIRFALQ